MMDELNQKQLKIFCQLILMFVHLEGLLENLLYNSFSGMKIHILLLFLLVPNHGHLLRCLSNIENFS